MSITAVITFVAVLIVGVTVFARAELFRPKVKSAYSTNPIVRLLMDACALACVFAGFELWGCPGQIPEGIVWLLTLCAVTSTAMLTSMLVHDGRMIVAEIRATDVADMKASVEEILPPVVERSLERVTTDFMRPAPDHDRLIRVEPIPPTSPPAD
jgi:hypothetical protein